MRKSTTAWGSAGAGSPFHSPRETWYALTKCPCSSFTCSGGITNANAAARRAAEAITSLTGGEEPTANRLPENALGDQSVDALGAVDRLRHVEIHGDAAKGVGVLAGEVLFRYQEVDGVAHRVDHRLVEAGVEAHGDPMRRRLAAWSFQVHVLAHDELEGSRERGFHRGDVRLAIALSGVAVAGLEERAFHVYRNVEGGALDEVFVIQIAGVDAGRAAVDAAGDLRRRHPHAAEERMERDCDAGAEMGDHALAVERDDLAAASLEIPRRQHAAVRAEAVRGIRGVEPDLADADLQRVAGLGAFDINRPRQNVAARAPVLDFGVDGLQFGLDVLLLDSAVAQGRRVVGAEGLDLDGVAGVNGEHRLRLRPVIAPDHRLRRGLELVIGREGAGEGQEEEQHLHNERDCTAAAP